MVKNYFKIAWRNLIKDRYFTLLNMLGLSTGLACTFLIYLWISDELRIDKFNTNDKRLFQVMKNVDTGDGVVTIENTQSLLATSLAADFPEVEYAAPYVTSQWFNDKGLISFNKTQVREFGQFAGRDFFKVFSYELIEGDRSSILSNKNGIAISDKLALKLFNSTSNVVGKAISWKHPRFSGEFSVLGVFKSQPASATDQFDLLFSYELYPDVNPQFAKWTSSDPNTYILLKEGTNAGAFNQKIAGYIKTKNPESKEILFARQYSRKHLYGQYENGVEAGGRIAYIRLFSIIAIFIVLIACINFTNLATARAAKRYKEIGIKKVMGANRFTLVLQFFGESLMLASFSFVFSMVLIFFCLPAFNTITGKQYDLNLNTNIIGVLYAITILTGLIAGIYPALYLSGFKPLAVFKKSPGNSVTELLVRKGLVVFQFTVSIILIIGVLVIYQQFNYIQTKNLGYKRHNIIWFESGIVSSNTDTKEVFENKLNHFISELKNIPGVINATNFRHSIVNRSGGTNAITWQGKAPDASIDFTDLAAGYNFIETLDIPMKEGRTFSQNYSSEKSKVIFNEAAIEAMDIKDPVGKTVNIWGEDKEIIGVAKNFHFESLYQKLKPAFFDFSINSRVSNVMVRIESGTDQQTISRIKDFYAKYSNGVPLEVKFLADDYSNLYAAEARISMLSRYFAGLAILISSLGLLGLMAYTAKSRQKEIGIRKVIGASVGSIVGMLSWDLLKLVLIAVLLAFPLAWWAADKWLSGFAYRIEIGPDLFLVTALAALGLSFIMLSVQAVRAALANPVTSLRAGG